MISEPAASRNCAPILSVLKKLFESAENCKILEIASGSGQHCIYFAQHLPNVIFQPSEQNPRYLHSIAAYVDHHRLPNVRIPLHIDVSKPPDLWALPVEFAPANLDAIIAINMIHYCSESAIDGLFKAAGSLLNARGKLITYGAYKFHGNIQPQSNRDFDAKLKCINAEFGLRDVCQLEEKASQSGLVLEQVNKMPANNHTLIFSRKPN